MDASKTGTASGRPNPHTDTGFSKATQPSGNNTKGGSGNTPPKTTGGGDVPFKKPISTAGSLILNSIVPFSGTAINMGALRNYKGRQKFARKQGLYRDYYKTTGKPLQPNSPEGKSYVKEAGYGKAPTVTPDTDRSPTVLPPPTAVAAKPNVTQPYKPYYMGFDFQKPIDENKQKRLPTATFKRGGLSGGKRFGPPPKKGPNPHGKCPFRKDGIRGVGAVERGRGVKFVGVK
jgi:hypothetical protein